MGSVLIKGGDVIPVDGKRRIIRNGAVYVEDDRIVAVGSVDEVVKAGTKADEVIDASGCVVTPGFIDTHVHLAQALLRGVVPDNLTLVPWLRYWIWPLQGVYDERDGYVSASLCILEMLKTGTTCFVESLLHTRYGFDGIASLVKDSGIRGMLGKSVMNLAGYSGSEQIIHPGMVEDGEACLREFKEMHKKWSGQADGRIEVWLGLRSPGALTDELFRESSRIAKEYNAGVTMHLAEIRQDIEYFQSIGTTPSKFLEKYDLLGPRRVYAHCVWLDERDMEAFAKTGASVAHCPSSNLKLGSGIAPVSDMLRKGVIVGLGCDGGPSNDCYDMVREMKLAALLQKGRTTDPNVFSAWDALELATINGARAIGWERELGSLEPGKKADIVVTSLKHPSVTPYTNPLSLLVYSATGRDVRDVIINGRVVVRDGRVLTMDEERIREEANKHIRRVLEKFERKIDLYEIIPP